MWKLLLKRLAELKCFLDEYKFVLRLSYNFHIYSSTKEENERRKKQHKTNVKTIKMKSPEITDVLCLRMCNLSNMTFSSTLCHEFLYDEKKLL